MKTKVTYMFYRRSPKAKTHILHGDQLHPGCVYFEFEETWLRLGEMQVDGTVPKRRLSQVATGRKFKYCDKISPELLEDSIIEQYKSNHMLLLMDPECFLYLRMKEV